MREAEQMQARDQPDYPLLYGVTGFRYCDLLLGPPERAAWQTQQSGITSQEPELIKACRAVTDRTAQTLNWAKMGGQGSLLIIALDQLTLGRAALYQAILENSDLRRLTSEHSNVDAAVAGLRRAGTTHHLPRALLTRVWLRSNIGRESAQEDLDEAWEIAERGPMRLFMAEIHLYRARLFHAVKPYPWNKFEDGSEGRGPKDDLADARKLIQRCGYWRRKEELEDAEEAAKSWD
jgi:hypothetical protein